VLTPAQFSKLTPVVAAAWAHHCAQRCLDPHKKKANGYRDWYEDAIVHSIGKNSTGEIRNASEFGKVLLAFAEIADDEHLIRDLAADEEHRNRWALRMMAVDLSFLRCEEVGWEYVRHIYGQSKLPPGEFLDCPAAILLKVIAMLDIQIQRECTRYGFSKHHLPRRASASMARLPHHAGASLQQKMLAVLQTVASANGYTVPQLVTWHDKMVASANAELRAIRNVESRPLEPDPAHASISTDSTQGEIPF
jgi:hypothetical protein